MMPAQRLQVAYVVIIATLDVIDLVCFRSTLEPGIKPNVLAAVTIATQANDSACFPVRRQRIETS